MPFKKIYIEITNICNMQCEFCTPHIRSARFISEKEFSHILDEIEPYGKYIYLHVKGEPLLHPNVDNMVKEASERGFFVSLTTNGTMLTEHVGIFHMLRQINLSLHATKDYNLIRELKNSENFKNINISIRLWNGEEAKESILFLEKEFNVVILMSAKRQKITENIFLSLEQPFKWGVAQSHQSTSELSTKTVRGYCLGLKNQIAILVDGTVVPCCLDHNGTINLGNIFEQKLDTILTSERAERIIKGFRNRKVEEETCRICNFRSRFDI